MDLDAHLEAFADYLARQDRAPGTVRVYVSRVRQFWRWWTSVTGDRPNPAAVTVLDLRDYRSHLLRAGGRGDSPASPATVNHTLHALRTYFDWLRAHGLAVDNPARSIRVVAQQPSPPRWLDRRELARLLRVIQQDRSARNRALLLLLLHTGLRISEALSLQRRDIVIRERSGTVAVRGGKGGKQRSVPLNATVRAALSVYLDELPEAADTRLFPLSARAVQRLLERYGRLAGIGRLTPHVLRHTFCHELAQHRVPIQQIASLAGHSQLAVTMRYVTPGAAELQDAVDRIAWE